MSHRYLLLPPFHRLCIFRYSPTKVVMTSKAYHAPPLSSSCLSTCCSGYLECCPLHILSFNQIHPYILFMIKHNRYFLCESFPNFPEWLITPSSVLPHIFRYLATFTFCLLFVIITILFTGLFSVLRLWLPPGYGVGYSLISTEQMKSNKIFCLLPVRV